MVKKTAIITSYDSNRELRNTLAVEAKSRGRVLSVYINGSRKNYLVLYCKLQNLLLNSLFYSRNLLNFIYFVIVNGNVLHMKIYISKLNLK